MNTATLAAVPAPPRRIPMSQLTQSMSHAGVLYVRYLGRWLLTIIMMAVTIEIFMLVPHVGLAFKIAASGILGAQIMAMFQAADGGEKPRPWRVLSAFAKPMGVTATLVAGVWFPLFIALAWTYFQDGQHVAATVLSQPGKLSPEAQLHFKMVLFAAAMPVTFIAPAVVIGRLRGMPAFVQAVIAAARNPLPVLLLSGSTIALEASIERLFHYLPGATGIILGTICTLLTVTAMAAWSYALGARIFSADASSSASSSASSDASSDVAEAAAPR